MKYSIDVIGSLHNGEARVDGSIEANIEPVEAELVAVSFSVLPLGAGFVLGGSGEKAIKTATHSALVYGKGGPYHHHFYEHPTVGALNVEVTFSIPDHKDVTDY